MQKYKVFEYQRSGASYHRAAIEKTNALRYVGFISRCVCDEILDLSLELEKLQVYLAFLLAGAVVLLHRYLWDLK